ncbi:MAG: hypothetical protein HRF47_15855 [Chloroflexota bacterium]|jgi:ABC-type spermidine/putrescine transport system permease subunit I
MRSHPLFSPWLSLAPALMLVTVLLGASLAYGVAQSLGLMSVIGQNTLSLESYRNLLTGQGAAGREFWVSLAFSLWISVTSTLISSALALLTAVWLSERRGASGNLDTLALNWNLAFPHLVWAVAILLFLSQSGLLARWAAALGIIQTPAEFPVLVHDRYGIGVILHYVSKEIPFLALMLLAVLRAQPGDSRPVRLFNLVEPIPAHPAHRRRAGDYASRFALLRRIRRQPSHDCSLVAIVSRPARAGDCPDRAAIKFGAAGFIPFVMP